MSPAGSLTFIPSLGSIFPLQLPYAREIEKASRRGRLLAMSTKAASFLAFVGMLVLTLLVLVDLVRDISGVVRGVVPMLLLVRAIVYTFASLTATVFFFVFYERQS